MHFKTIDEIITHARSVKKHKVVAVPAANDEHAIEAVFRAYKEGIVVPRLIGNEGLIRECLEKQGAEELVPFIVPENGGDSACAQKAVDMARSGEAELLLKGSLQSSDYLRPIVSHNGLKKRSTMSAVAVMSVPAYHKIFVMTDGGLLLKPTLEQKKEEILNAVEALRGIGYDEEIRVAVLCSSETVNPKLPEMVDAAALKEMNLRGEIPDCIVEGPISFDLATNKDAAEAKGYQSPVAGEADILVVPDLVSGNILGKALGWAGSRGVNSIGGTTVPVALPSRGSSAETKYEILVYCALMA